MPDSPAKPRLAYLYSRYPVVSQTFCDSEMLCLESLGFRIEVASLNRPPNSFRHERLDRLRAEIHYPPPPEVLAALCDTPEFESTLGPLIRDHEARYGAGFKPAVRARNAWVMGRRLRQLGVGHVHVHFANRATHSALFLKRMGFTFSFTAHAQDFMVDLGSRELLAEMAREAELVVAVSDFSKGLLCDLCPDSRDKISRIYNGIELDDFPAAAAPEPRPALRLVSVGRLIEFKGFQHLIEACGLLRDAGVAVEARIIGEGPLRGELEARIAQSGLTGQVRLLGVRSQEEIKRELACADLFVLPSIIDSAGASDILPTVITEAMACRLPVVSTTVAGIPEMVLHEKTGLLTPPGDAAALAAAIRQLGADPATRENMGEAGRRHAEATFSFAATAAVLGQRLEQICTTGKAPDRQELPIVYFCPRWQGQNVAQHGPRLGDGVRWIASELDVPIGDADRTSLAETEFLPDASVIESLWLRRADARQALEAARNKLSDHVSGTDFYTAARHAVYLAEVLPKRGTRHLHARGSGAVVTAWLLKQLLPGLHLSCAIENEPALSRSLLAKLLPAFDLASVSDSKLAAQLPGGARDDLQLDSRAPHRELRLGPLRIKRKAAAPAPDRAALESAFLARIRQALPAAPATAIPSAS